jgi:hypothetical protein
VRRRQDVPRDTLARRTRKRRLSASLELKLISNLALLIKIDLYLLGVAMKVIKVLNEKIHLKLLGAIRKTSRCNWFTNFRKFNTLSTNAR